MEAFYKHQEDMLAMLTSHKQFAINAEAGCGKTLPMLWHLTNLLKSGAIDDALVIAPKSALQSWTMDVKKLPLSRQRECQKISFVNYDLVWRRQFFDKHWGAVVCDESHLIAHRQSKRTKFIMSLSAKSEYRYIMTGTPIGQGRLEDYWSQFEFLLPGYFGKWKDFAGRYLIERTIKGTWASFVVGYRNKQELLDKVSAYTYAIRKRDCLDLPEKLPDVIVRVPLTTPQKKLFKEIDESYVPMIDKIIDNPLVKGAFYREVSSGFLYDDNKNVVDVGSGKMAMLEELLDSILPYKVVIFAQFTNSISNIEALLDKKKITYVELSGRQNDKTIWSRFLEDDNVQVIVCQYESANAGINLYSSSHMIFFEPSLATITVSQARDRIHRIGQKQACSYYWLLTEDSIEEAIYKRLEKKEDFTNECIAKFVEETRRKV